MVLAHSRSARPEDPHTVEARPHNDNGDETPPDTLPSAPQTPEPKAPVDPVAAAESAIWRVSWREQLVALLRANPVKPKE